MFRSRLKYFKRLWCVIIHKGRWEYDGFGSARRCALCGEIHNENG